MYLGYYNLKNKLRVSDKVKSQNLSNLLNAFNDKLVENILAKAYIGLSKVSIKIHDGRLEIAD